MTIEEKAYDEVIRKELIQFIKNWKDPNNIGRPHDFPTLTRNAEQCDRYIAWLERASKFYNNEECRVGMTPVDLEVIFPELKESEDEKIRKALIDYFDDANKADENPLQSYGIHTDKAIAWLEKRSEPTDINPSEFDLRLNKLLKQFETLPKEELASSLSFYLNVVQNDGTYKDEEKQGEQNPIINVPSREVILAIWDLGNEWKELTNGSISTEYGTQLDYIQKHWHESEYYLREKQGEQNLADKLEDEEYNGEDYGIDSLFHAQRILEKTLGKVDGYQTDDGILAHQCAITAVKKLYEHKPAEWSEEDETRLTNIIIMLKEGASHHFIKDDITKAVDWLKSLRPQNHWKPTEEQVEAFEHFVRSIGESGYASPYENNTKLLYSLLNDLEKLIE